MGVGKDLVLKSRFTSFTRRELKEIKLPVILNGVWPLQEKTKKKLHVSKNVSEWISVLAVQGAN